MFDFISQAVVVVTADIISIKPNDSLPGVKQFEKLIGGLMVLLLLVAVVGILLGLATKTLGSKAGNHGAAQTGNQMIYGGVMLAVGTGAAVAIVLFFLGIGQQVS